MPITVLIADGKASVRTACAKILKPEKGIRVVGDAASGPAVLAAAMRLKPSILLLDLTLTNTKNGKSLLTTICGRLPHTTVILLTQPSSERRILEALCCGARGYIAMKSLRMFLPKAVRVVHSGEAWVPRKMVAKILDRLMSLTSQTR